MTQTKFRSSKQNASLHLMFEHLADELNDAGYDMKKTLKEEVNIPWDGVTIKEYLWRPVMKAQLGIESTTELTTGDIDKVFNTINRHLAEKFGLETHFPSIETIIMNERTNERD